MSKEEIIAGTGTVALNIITWSGTIDAFELGQKVLTALLTAAMIVFYVYHTLEKRRSYLRKDKPSDPDK